MQYISLRDIQQQPVFNSILNSPGPMNPSQDRSQDRPVGTASPALHDRMDVVVAVLESSPGCSNDPEYI